MIRDDRMVDVTGCNIRVIRGDSPFRPFGRQV
jgi:hypothetical protein